MPVMLCQSSVQHNVCLGSVSPPHCDGDPDSVQALSQTKGSYGPWLPLSGSHYWRLKQKNSPKEHGAAPRESREIGVGHVTSYVMTLMVMTLLISRGLQPETTSEPAEAWQLQRKLISAPWGQHRNDTPGLRPKPAPAQ